MDKFLSLISSIESAIRYLLTGAAVAALWVISRDNAACIAEWTEDHLEAVMAATAVLGFAVFSIYRLMLWIIGDCVAYRAEWSVPAKLRKKGECDYAGPYARFLEWRYWDKPGLPEKLSGYLNYRWSVTHFAIVSAATCLAMAFGFAQSGSILYEYRWPAGIMSVVVLVFGFLQARFLYKVEGELCTLRPHNSAHHAEAPKGV
jgi:hypothetical protein